LCPRLRVSLWCFILNAPVLPNNFFRYPRLFSEAFLPPSPPPFPMTGFFDDVLFLFPFRNLPASADLAVRRTLFFFNAKTSLYLPPLPILLKERPFPCRLLSLDFSISTLVARASDSPSLALFPSALLSPFSPTTPFPFYRPLLFTVWISLASCYRKPGKPFPLRLPVQRTFSFLHRLPYDRGIDAWQSRNVGPPLFSPPFPSLIFFVFFATPCVSPVPLHLETLLPPWWLPIPRFAHGT